MGGMRTVVMIVALTTALSPISGHAGSKHARASDDDLNPFEQVDRMPAAAENSRRSRYIDTSTAQPQAPVVVPSAPVEGSGYRYSSGFEQAKAYCELYADRSQSGHLSFGSLAFVIGSEIGAAIGNGIEHAHAYDMCMTMRGYARQ